MRQEEVEAHVDDIFSRLDTNRDGVVTIEEFVEACQRVSEKNMLQALDIYCRNASSLLSLSLKITQKCLILLHYML